VFLLIDKTGGCGEAYEAVVVANEFE